MRGTTQNVRASVLDSGCCWMLERLQKQAVAQLRGQQMATGETPRPNLNGGKFLDLDSCIFLPTLYFNMVSSAHSAHTFHSHLEAIKSLQSIQICMFLNFGRKLEKSHATRGRTCKLKKAFSPILKLNPGPQRWV